MYIAYLRLAIKNCSNSFLSLKMADFSGNGGPKSGTSCTDTISTL